MAHKIEDYEQGYDPTRFEHPVPPVILCNICHGVLRNPRMCHNEHMFCLACILRRLQNSVTCPTCPTHLTPETLKGVPRFVRNYLLELKIICNYKDLGCPEYVELENLEKHVDQCQFAPATAMLMNVNLENERAEHIHDEDSCQMDITGTEYKIARKRKQDEMNDQVNQIEACHDELRSSTEASNTEVPWNESSKKHRSKLSKLAEILKTAPSKATSFGEYHVCLDEEFCIGEGSDGTDVYVGLSDEGHEVAVKHLNMRQGQEISDNEKQILNSPNVRNKKHIVKYRYHHKVNSKEHFVVLDLHEESLRDYVRDEAHPVEQLRKEGPSIISQILNGIEVLHCGKTEILHRDLKPENVLVNLEGEMVLADFGISRALPRNQTTYKSGVRGTEGWMAVESLPNEDDDELSDADIQVRYKKQSDIQVVGMLCYYVLTKGKHPYGQRMLRNYNISQGEFDLKDLSDPYAKDLITWMLQHDPAERPDVHQCLKHPYLRTAEENFNLVLRVGNEREIKTRDATSIVVQEINKLPVFTNWLSMIEACVMNYMTARRTCYTNDATDLLRYIRNMEVHWRDKTPPANVQSIVVTPQEYFERKFPTLAVELHRIIRGNFDWATRKSLIEYF